MYFTLPLSNRTHKFLSNKMVTLQTLVQYMYEKTHFVGMIQSVWWLPILCCFSCTFHNEQPSNSINFLDTHALIAESRLCIIIMSSHSLHNRLTQISQNAKVWKTSLKFANLTATMVRIIGCELHWFVFRGDHCLNSRVPIIGDRIIRSSNSAMV